jgi:tRNA A37 methylthiotransferase MiaB
MNVADSEVVASILEMDGFVLTDNADKADLVLINTCPSATTPNNASYPESTTSMRSAKRAKN